jgi:hypothetical protein
MKPRIRKDRGTWICFASYLTLSGCVRVRGDGYTPAEAYADWLEQWKENMR